MPAITDVGPSALIALVLGSMLIGVASEALGEGPVRHEWIITGVGAFLVALMLGGAATVAPAFDGLAVVPALLGGLVGAGVTNVAFRSLSYELAARGRLSARPDNHGVRTVDRRYAHRSAPVAGR
jgi:hypothetical protein